MFTFLIRFERCATRPAEKPETGTGTGKLIFPVSGFKAGRVIPFWNRINNEINFNFYNLCSKIDSLGDF